MEIQEAISVLSAITTRSTLLSIKLKLRFRPCKSYTTTRGVSHVTTMTYFNGINQKLNGSLTIGHRAGQFVKQKRVQLHCSTLTST